MKKQKYILAEDLAYGIKEGLFKDTKGRALVRIWKLGLADEKITGMIQYRIRKHKTSELFNDHPFKIPSGADL